MLAGEGHPRWALSWESAHTEHFLQYIQNTNRQLTNIKLADVVFVCAFYELVLGSIVVCVVVVFGVIVLCGCVCCCLCFLL